MISNFKSLIYQFFIPKKVLLENQTNSWAFMENLFLFSFLFLLLNPLTMAPIVWDGDFIRWGKSFPFILHSFVIEGESDCDKCDCDECE